MKLDPHTGKAYGLDGEMARNYVKYGLYVKDSDPRLRPGPMRFLRRLGLVK